MKRKILLNEIDEHHHVYRDPKTGIAWVEDTEVGCGHSCHPNIDKTGSVTGMKKKGLWQKNHRTVRSHGFIYNIDLLTVTDEYDEIARHYCDCGGDHYGFIKVIECGCCGHWHQTTYTGDCRNDQERFCSPEDAANRLGVGVIESYENDSHNPTPYFPGVEE